MTDIENAPTAEDLEGDFGEKTDFDRDNQMKAALTHAVGDMDSVGVDDGHTMDWDTYEAMSKDPNALYEASLKVEDPADAMPPKKDEPKPSATAAPKNGPTAAKSPAPPPAAATKPKAAVVTPAPAVGPAAKPPAAGGKPAAKPTAPSSDDLHAKVVPVANRTGPTVTRSGIQSGPVPVIKNLNPPTSPNLNPATSPNPSNRPGAVPSALPPSEPAPPTPAPNLAAPRPRGRPIVVAGLGLAVAGLLYVIALSFGWIGEGANVEGLEKESSFSNNMRKRFGGKKQDPNNAAGTTTTSTIAPKPELIDMTYKAREVTIKFTCNAPACDVQIDGVPHDGPLVVTRSTKDKYQARVSAKGYVPANYVIPADEDRTVHFDLEKLH